MIKKTVTNWENVPDDISNYVGFVYVIINKETNQKYIGKKFFWFTNRVKVKDRKNRKIVVSESDWRTYESSDKELISEIKSNGKDKYRFIILNCYCTKRELTYAEVEYQIKCDVLTRKLPNGDYEYVNKNILGKFFR